MSDKPLEVPIDRTDWLPGPWDDEPNRVDFRAHGLPCFVLRSDCTGSWCGYVGAPRGIKINPKELGVHGGVNYVKPCSPPICHVPEPGESDDLLWYGFDCSHAFDVSPAMGRELVEFLMRGERAKYRDLAYVRAETEQLAEQLAAFVAEARR